MAGWRARLDNLVVYYRTHGAIKFISYLFQRMGIRAYRNRQIFFLEADLTQAYEPDLPPKDLTFKLATADIIDQIPNYFDGWFYGEQAKNRLRQGKQLLIAFHQGKAIGFQWIVFNRIEIDYIDMSFVIPKDTAWLEYLYIPKPSRGKGYAPHIIAEARRRLTALGFRRIVTDILPDNIRSIRTFTRGSNIKVYELIVANRFLFYHNLNIIAHNGQEPIAGIRSNTPNRPAWERYTRI